jgi:hypothetical protein
MTVGSLSRSSASTKGSTAANIVRPYRQCESGKDGSGGRQVKKSEAQGSSQTGRRRRIRGSGHAYRTLTGNRQRPLSNRPVGASAPRPRGELANGQFGNLFFFNSTGIISAAIGVNAAPSRGRH